MTPPGEIELHRVEVFVVDPRIRQFDRKMRGPSFPAAAMKTLEAFSHSLMKLACTLLNSPKLLQQSRLASPQALTNLFQLVCQRHGTPPSHDLRPSQKTRVNSDPTSGPPPLADSGVPEREPNPFKASQKT